MAPGRCRTGAGRARGRRPARRSPPARVTTLEPAWRFRFRGKGGGFGFLTSTPLVVGGTVYVQDAKSSVFALERSSGRLRWARLYTAPNDGPNGAAVVGDRVVAATDTTVFALNRANGRRMWSRRLTDRDEQFVDIAPVVDRGRVYVSTVGFPPGGRGAIYALDLAHGSRRAGSSTRSPSRGRPRRPGAAERGTPCRSTPRVASTPASRTPGPWGGTKARPNGGAFRGRTLYTDSLVVLDGATGRLLWYDQVFPPRRPRLRLPRDADPRRGPVAASWCSAPGREVASSRGTGRRAGVSGRASVGTHLNDVGPAADAGRRACAPASSAAC